MPFYKRHGLTDTPTHSSWCSMNSRCNNPKVHQYPYYGGKGIKVCERWKSFENFLSDMGPRPEGMTLDRINNTKDYEPSNCRWATRDEQSKNRTTSINITFNGKTQLLAEWARELGINPGTLANRLKSGWAIDRALTAAVR